MEKNNIDNKSIRTIKNIFSYVIVIVVAILIKVFIFSPVKVNGTSMSPTLENGDIMILNEIGYYLNGLDRFDIAVANIDGERLIDRIIKQLHEVGVFDITVVVGYMKDAFEYLMDEEGISLVYNKEYASKNNTIHRS